MCRKIQSVRRQDIPRNHVHNDKRARPPRHRLVRRPLERLIARRGAGERHNSKYRDKKNHSRTGKSLCSRDLHRVDSSPTEELALDGSQMKLSVRRAAEPAFEFADVAQNREGAQFAQFTRSL